MLQPCQNALLFSVRVCVLSANKLEKEYVLILNLQLGQDLVIVLQRLFLYPIENNQFPTS